MRALCALFLLLGACENVPRLQDLATNADAGARDLATPDLAGTIEFESFVLDLVQHHTNDTETPVTTQDKTFVDSMDPATLSVLFP